MAPDASPFPADYLAFGKAHVLDEAVREAMIAESAARWPPGRRFVEDAGLSRNGGVG